MPSRHGVQEKGDNLNVSNPPKSSITLLVVVASNPRATCRCYSTLVRIDSTVKIRNEAESTKWATLPSIFIGDADYIGKSIPAC